MSQTVRTLPSDASLVGAILARVAEDLGMLLGHDVEFEAPRIERARARPAGAGLVHISFKLGFGTPAGGHAYGAALVPLPDALTMSCFLLMIPEETVAARREEPAPDATLKDALLEIGNMIGGAANTALEKLGLSGWSARSEGCQGVRAGVRPAFPYEEGSELVVARVGVRLAPFPVFELILILPPPG